MTEYLLYFNQQWVGEHSEEWFNSRAPLAMAAVDEMKLPVSTASPGARGGPRPQRGSLQRRRGGHRRAVRRDQGVPGRVHRGGRARRRDRADVGGQDRRGVWLAPRGAPLRAASSARVSRSALAVTGRPAASAEQDEEGGADAAGDERDDENDGDDLGVHAALLFGAVMRSEYDVVRTRADRRRLTPWGPAQPNSFSQPVLLLLGAVVPVAVAATVAVTVVVGGAGGRRAGAAGAWPSATPRPPRARGSCRARRGRAHASALRAVVDLHTGRSLMTRVAESLGHFMGVLLGRASAPTVGRLSWGSSGRDPMPLCVAPGTGLSSATQALGPASGEA